MFKRSILSVLGLLLAGLTLAPSAAAAGIFVPEDRVLGIRLTQTGSGGLSIDFDVTVFYTIGFTGTDSYYYFAQIGYQYGDFPQVDFGDGDSVSFYEPPYVSGYIPFESTTTIGGTPARAYRGSFSHTYGAPGSYTISSTTNCCAPGYSSANLETGYYTTAVIQTTTTFFSSITTFTTTRIKNTLEVAALNPGFSKVFMPNPTGIGIPSTLTFTIDNSASTLADDELAFTDNLPMGLVVAPMANVMNTCTGGTVTAVPGTSTIDYMDGRVEAGEACAISVDVVAAMAGSYENTSGDLTSARGNSGPATDTLDVSAAPAFNKSFSQGTVFPGSTVTLTFAIDNSANAVPVTGLDFTDNLPAGIVVATPPNAMNGCGGMLMADAGDSVISLSDGIVGAMTTCTIDVDVLVTGSGDLFNDAGLLDTDVGSSPAAATASITALADIPVLSSKSMILLALLLGMIGVAAMRRSVL